jgi:hypothetical protein
MPSQQACNPTTDTGSVDSTRQAGQARPSGVGGHSLLTPQPHGWHSMPTAHPATGTQLDSTCNRQARLVIRHTAR